MNEGGNREMETVILETDVLGAASQAKYQDSLDSYEFPRRYLSHFDPLAQGREMLALFYEPRGKPPKGRMSFVGWSVLQGVAPAEVPGQANMYRVDFVDPIRSFQRPVPRENDGEPIERWLGQLPRGRHRNVATVGRAMRNVIPEDAEIILRLGAADVKLSDASSAADAPDTTENATARVRQTVDRLQRSARFRADVLAAYSWQCAISGLAADGVDGLVEAAHIRAAGEPNHGPDHITNGIALTPTLHRMFDRHLFSFEYQEDQLTIVTSSRLTSKMIQANHTDSALRLRDGQIVDLPADPKSRPDRRYVTYHRSRLLS